MDETTFKSIIQSAREMDSKTNEAHCDEWWMEDRLEVFEKCLLKAFQQYQEREELRKHI